MKWWEWAIAWAWLILVIIGAWMVMKGEGDD
jgi:hypothetical protein